MKFIVIPCFSALNLANCAFFNFSLNNLGQAFINFVTLLRELIEFINILYCIYISFVYSFVFITSLFLPSLHLICCSFADIFEMDALITNFQTFIFYYMHLWIHTHIDPVSTALPAIHMFYRLYFIKYVQNI